jgi:uncharacterized membrane protein YhaH (DUF805 family)
MPFCYSCGNAVSDIARFCGKCGKPVGQVQTSPALQAPVQAAPAPENTSYTPHYAQEHIGGPDNFSLWNGFCNGWKNTFNYKGRARRKEFWGFCLFNSIFSFGFLFCCIIAAIATATGDKDATVAAIGLGVALMYLIPLLPSISILVRRLHDINRTALFAILFYSISFVTGATSLLNNETLAAVCGLVNIVLAIFWFIYTCKDGNPHTNNYGPDPKGRNA